MTIGTGIAYLAVAGLIAVESFCHVSEQVMIGSITAGFISINLPTILKFLAGRF